MTKSHKLTIGCHSEFYNLQGYLGNSKRCMILISATSLLSLYSSCKMPIENDSLKNHIDCTRAPKWLQFQVTLPINKSKLTRKISLQNLNASHINHTWNYRHSAKSQCNTHHINRSGITALFQLSTPN